MGLRSWGLPGPFAQDVIEVDERFSLPPSTPLLAYGNGRSYGDSCLNQGGTLLHTRALSHLIDFDAASGMLECGAGVTFADIIEVFLPRGWFLPVTPGTRYITVGGAIANDVHGKNHHRAGTFGDHLVAFKLLRSDLGMLDCSRACNPELFRATVGGLGLTGIIMSAQLRLRRVDSGWMEVASTRFHSLREYIELDDAAATRSEYCVSWIDCVSARGEALKGVCLEANHAPAPAALARYPDAPKMKNMPFTPPVSLISGWSLKLFNHAYFLASQDKRGVRQSLYPYFYPLDALGHWNRIYGAKGFFQFQCVVPKEPGIIAALLEAVARAKEGSFLAVLKGFGARPPQGMLSFARPGITLALDFPNRGAATSALLSALGDIVGAAGGALYPAKDANMSEALFRIGYPNLEQFMQYRDPRFSSSFWRRLFGAPD